MDIIRNSIFLICCFFLSCVCYTGDLYGQQALAPQNANVLLSDTLRARDFLEEEKSLALKGDYVAAINAVEAAKLIYSKHQLWEQVIDCEILQSGLAYNLEPSTLMLRHAQSAVELSKKHLSENHPYLASAFRQKAEVLTAIGKLDSANHFLRLAIPTFKVHQKWTDLAWSEIILGVNFLNQYQLDSAQIHFDVVNQLIADQPLDEISLSDIRATLLQLSGVLYNMQGDYDKAIKNTKQALELDLSKETFSHDDSIYIQDHYNNLGAYFFTKGDYHRALDHFNQAIFFGKIEKPSVLNNIGNLLVKQNKNHQAIGILNQSLAYIKDEERQIEELMNATVALGKAYKNLGILDSALYYSYEAIELPTTYRQFMAQSNTAHIFLQKKDPKQALDHLDFALAQFFKDSINITRIISELPQLYKLKGDAYFQNQDFNTALAFYQKSLITNHSQFRDSLELRSNPSLIGIYNPILFLNTIRSKAKTQAAFTDQQKAALATYQLSVQWIDSLLASYNSEAAQLDWSSEFKPIYEEAIQVAYRLHQSSNDPKYLDLAFAFSEKSKNAILLETLKSNEGKSQGGVPDSLIQKEKDLNLDIAFYEKSLRKAQDGNLEAKEKLYKEYLSKARLELAALREQLELDYPKFHDWKYSGKTTTIADVQSKLINNQGIFLEYFLGDSTAFVFVIDKNSAALLPLAPPLDIRTSVNNFQSALLDYSSFKQNAKAAFINYQQKAVDVYQHILKKPLERFPSGIQQLIIVPDGSLNSIPFEALCNEQEVGANFDFALLPYLLYDFKIDYAYSANLLLKNQEQFARLPAISSCLAFAPPYKDDELMTQRGGAELLRSNSGHLVGTIEEIKQIARFIKGEFDFSQTATEKKFKTLAPQFGILHLAMHGVADMDNANFNHLKFSNLTKDSIEDNLLHHYEIANMTLQAQLVVLSACETGVGKYEKGEGVFSLARSFMYAGAPSIVMSLWNVSDVSTSQLMPYLYEELADGQSKDAALQQAKLRFLENADIEYRHPFYWSAFVVMGDAQALKDEAFNFYWMGLGIGMLVLLFLLWRKYKHKKKA